MARGVFITFEGPECSGKSTQVSLLQRRLERDGYDVVRTKEPGASSIGTAIRNILLSPASDLTPMQELLLFYSDRIGHIAQVIRPALSRGAIVLSDRFDDSTVAYQHYGRGIPLDRIRQLRAIAVGDLQPDLTLFYNIPIAEMERRVRSRKLTDRTAKAESRFDDELRQFHERVRRGYLAMVAESPSRFRVLDGAQDKDALHAQTFALVQTLLREKTKKKK